MDLQILTVKETRELLEKRKTHRTFDLRRHMRLPGHAECGTTITRNDGTKPDFACGPFVCAGCRREIGVVESGGRVRLLGFGPEETDEPEKASGVRVVTRGQAGGREVEGGCPNLRS